MCPKDVEEMANSVDPDLIGAVWSVSALFAHAFLPKTYSFYGNWFSDNYFSLLC